MAWVYFASGFASLVYQVAWQRMLTLHTGTSALSTTLIVSAWMLGLGVGALVSGPLAHAAQRPSRAYAALEAALGVLGLLSLPVASLAGPTIDVLPPALGFAAVFTCLSVPTALMGATLPLLAEVAVPSRQFTTAVSHLYFANTMGAAVGAVVTGYLLVSLLGLGGCVMFAAIVNFALAVVMGLRGRRESVAVQPDTNQACVHTPGTCGADVRLSGTGEADPRLAEPSRANAEDSRGVGASAAPRELSWPFVVALAFVSGFLAIGYEIVWYRVVGILVKDSPYAFASVLGVYLAGLALGSLAVSRAHANAAARRRLFFRLQFLAAVVVLATVAAFFHLAGREPLQALVNVSFAADAHPSLAVFAGSSRADLPADLFLLVDVFFWPIVFVLAPTALLGGCLPLVASLAFDRRGAPGPAVGASYAAVVAGNVLGGLVTGLALLPAIGTERTVLAFGSVGLLFGIGMGGPGRGIGASLSRAAVAATLAITAAYAFPRSGELYAAMHIPPFAPSAVRFAEGRDAVVLTYEQGARLRNFINGQGHGYRPGPVFFAEAIAALGSAQADPRDVLVVGLGAGSIVETALLAAETGRVRVVELCSSLVENLEASPVVAPVLSDPRLDVTIDDGRRFLRRTGKRFDAILLDPVRTTTASSNNLHSREFFALASTRLSRGGVVLVGGIGDSPVIARTLMGVFGHVRCYPGYCVASDAPLVVDGPRRARLLRALPAGMRREVVELLSGGVLEGADLELATRGARINEDWRPVSEYYLFQFPPWPLAGSR